MDHGDIVLAVLLSFAVFDVPGGVCGGRFLVGILSVTVSSIFLRFHAEFSTLLPGLFLGNCCKVR